MPKDWDNLAVQFGPKSVMSLTITDEELNAETERQIPLLEQIIEPLLDWDEETVLDFGCGAGRFTQALADMIRGRATGFDPCAGLIERAPGGYNVDYVSCPADQFFAECRAQNTTYGVVFAFGVLGAPGLDLGLTARGLVDVLAPKGLLVIADHMSLMPAEGKWWIHRHPSFYRLLFSGLGIELHQEGIVTQLDNAFTILAGRR